MTTMSRRWLARASFALMLAAVTLLPFLVISAGTRNHFALDLGLDREDPATCLNALSDGEELRVDLGVTAGRSRAQSGPGMAAAAAARVLPRPAR